MASDKIQLDVSINNWKEKLKGKWSHQVMAPDKKRIDVSINNWKVKNLKVNN